MKPFHVFQGALATALIVLLALMAAALALHADGPLAPEQTSVLLRFLYWGTYPLTFLALGALAVHAVRRERGLA